MQVHMWGVKERVETHARLGALSSAETASPYCTNAHAYFLMNVAEYNH